MVQLPWKNGVFWSAVAFCNLVVKIVLHNVFISKLDKQLIYWSDTIDFVL